MQCQESRAPLIPFNVLQKTMNWNINILELGIDGAWIDRDRQTPCQVEDNSSIQALCYFL